MRGRTRIALAAFAAALTALASAGAAAAGTPAREVVAYYPGWSARESRPFLPKDVPAERITTLAYFAVTVDVKRRRCTFGSDEALALRRPFAAAESVDGVADSGAPGELAGLLGQLRKLKAAHPHLRIVASVVSWWGTEMLAGPAATVRSRQRFVRSCVDLLIRGKLPGVAGPVPGLFDGIDVDWEYPRGAEQRADFTRLAREFRRQLDAVRPGLTLTAALPASPHAPEQFELDRIAGPLDWVNLMAYDLHGAWDPRTNFNAPLGQSPGLPDDGLTVDAAVRQLLDAGVPADRLVLGVPFYGRGWRGVGRASDGLGQAARCGKRRTTCPAPHDDHPGILEYRDLAPLYAGGRLFRDEAAQQVWTYDPRTRVLWTSDDPGTVAAKMAYAVGLGLRGAMVWEISQDTDDFALLSAVAAGLGLPVAAGAARGR